MIIVTGSVQCSPETVAEAVQLSLQHVHRSRLEPGCLLHSVHHDVEDPNRLVFVEHWLDLDSLRDHFGVPESRAFARTLNGLATSPARLDIYAAQATTV